MREEMWQFFFEKKGVLFIGHLKLFECLFVCAIEIYYTSIQTGRMLHLRFKCNEIERQ